MAALVVACGAACGPETGPDTLPSPAAQLVVSEPAVLSTGSPTKDEDPSVLHARDGRLYVAWFSDRGGNPDIYLTRTSDGREWLPPVRVSSDPGGDFNPSLIQDEAGTFHLVWFRWTALFRGHIVHSSSPDGVTWNASAEELVTTEDGVDDWVPALAQAASGSLVVCFVSAARDPASGTSQLYVAIRRPGGAWERPFAPAGLNSAGEHDHLPFLARTGSSLTLVFVRHDTSQALPWLNHKSDLFQATSGDGTSWSAPTRITSDAGDVVNLFPDVFADHDGRWFLTWVTTRFAPTGGVVELPLADAGRYPTGLVPNPQLQGYSPKVTATSTPGIFLGAWVQGPEGSQDVYYRFFRR